MYLYTAIFYQNVIYQVLLLISGKFMNVNKVAICLRSLIWGQNYSKLYCVNKSNPWDQSWPCSHDLLYLQYTKYMYLSSMLIDDNEHIVITHAKNKSTACGTNAHLSGAIILLKN